MKYLLFIPVAIFFCLTGKAQKFDLNKNQSLDELKRKKFLSDKMDNLTSDTLNAYSENEQENQDPGVLKMSQKGKYLGSDGKGNEIFAMEPDNMPCLVPGKNFSSNMPVAEYRKKNNTFLLPHNNNGRLFPKQKTTPQIPK